VDLGETVPIMVERATREEEEEGFLYSDHFLSASSHADAVDSEGELF